MIASETPFKFLYRLELAIMLVRCSFSAAAYLSNDDRLMIPETVFEIICTLAGICMLEF